MEKELMSDDNSYQKNIKRELRKAISSTITITDDVKKKYDLIVLGSDEIWNGNSASDRFCRQYWGQGIKAKHKISYAPCAINVSEKRLLLKIFALWRMDAISVRDNISKQKISRFVKKTVHTVLDPTFLIKYDFVDKRVIDEPYILVYSYGLDDNQKNEIIQFAKENKLKIVVSGYYANWADVNLHCTPLEWLSLFKYAQFVFTTTFHGSVFSIIFRKQFALLGNNQKASELLKDLGLSNQICKNELLKDHISKKEDFENTEKILHDKIKYSTDFIINSIME